MQNKHYFSFPFWESQRTGVKPVGPNSQLLPKICFESSPKLGGKTRRFEKCRLCHCLLNLTHSFPVTPGSHRHGLISSTSNTFQAIVWVLSLSSRSAASLAAASSPIDPAGPVQSSAATARHIRLPLTHCDLPPKNIHIGVSQCAAM